MIKFFKIVFAFLLFSTSAFSIYLQDLDIRAVINGEREDYVCLPSGEWVRIVVNNNGKILDQQPIEALPGGTTVNALAYVNVTDQKHSYEVRHYDRLDLKQYNLVATWGPEAMAMIGNEAFLLYAGDKKLQKTIYRKLPLGGKPKANITNPAFLHHRSLYSQMISVGKYLVVYQVEGNLVRIDSENNAMIEMAQDAGYQGALANFEGQEFFYLHRGQLRTRHIETGDEKSFGEFYPGIRVERYSLFRDSTGRLIRLQHVVNDIGPVRKFYELDANAVVTVDGMDHVIHRSGEVAEIRVDEIGNILHYRSLNAGRGYLSNAVNAGARGVVALTQKGVLIQIVDIKQPELYRRISGGWKGKDIAVIGDDVFALEPNGVLWKKSLTTFESKRLLRDVGVPRQMIAVGDMLILSTADKGVLAIDPQTKTSREIDNNNDAQLIAENDESFLVKAKGSLALKRYRIANLDHGVELGQGYWGESYDNGGSRIFVNYLDRVFRLNVERADRPARTRISDLDIHQHFSRGMRNYVLTPTGELYEVTIADGQVFTIKQLLGEHNEKFVAVAPYETSGFVAITDKKMLLRFDDVQHVEQIGPNWRVNAMAIDGDNLFVAVSSNRIWEQNVRTKEIRRVVNSERLSDVNSMLKIGDHLVVLKNDGAILKVAMNGEIDAVRNSGDGIVAIFAYGNTVLALDEREIFSTYRLDGTKVGKSHKFYEGIYFGDRYFYKDRNDKIVGFANRLKSTFRGFGKFKGRFSLVAGLGNNNAYTDWGPYSANCPVIGDYPRSKMSVHIGNRVAIKIPNDYFDNLPQDILLELQKQRIDKDNVDIFINAQSSYFLGESEDHEYDRTHLTSRLKAHAWLTPNVPGRFKGRYYADYVQLGIYSPESDFFESEVAVGKLRDFRVVIHDDKWSPRTGRVKLLPFGWHQAFWSLAIGRKANSHLEVKQDTYVGELDLHKSAAVTLHLLVPQLDFHSELETDHGDDIERFLWTAFIENPKYAHSHFSAELKKLLYSTK